MKRYVEIISEKDEIVGTGELLEIRNDYNYVSYGNHDNNNNETKKYFSALVIVDGTKKVEIVNIDKIRIVKREEEENYFVLKYKEDPDHPRPFSFGMPPGCMNVDQQDTWTETNCQRCKKGIVYGGPDDFKCDLQEKVQDSYWNSGEVSRTTAKRMGYNVDIRRLFWFCPEQKLLDKYKNNQI